jgi:hypothetical protein
MDRVNLAKEVGKKKQNGEIPAMGGEGKEPFCWDTFFDPENVRKLDKPRQDVIVDLYKERDKGNQIVIMSGRSDITKEATIDCLRRDNIPFDRIWMRPHKDHRKDTDLKLDFLDRYTDGKPLRAYDDRPCVIRAWQSRGIEVIDVGNGVEF